jgi:C1A family cysteine protease
VTLELSRGGRRYGYHKDKADHRDFGVSHLGFTLATSEKRSNISLLGPVLDQGDEGSCTAHAAAADREFLHWKEIENRNGTVAPGDEGLYSPAFIYYKEREFDGTLDQGDCGSYGRTSCMVLTRFGATLRSDMPYVPGDFSTAPTSEQLAEARIWQTGGYHRLATVQDMKNCIASGYCHRIGFAVDEGFEGIQSDGIWYKAGKVLGGHETLVIGYDDTVNGGSFQVRNSWGKDWGQAGNFWMPYRYAADPNILMDAWIQHLGKW